MIGRLFRAVKRFIFRSSQTGRFVSRDYAAKHPDVTERERI